MRTTTTTTRSSRAVWTRAARARASHGAPAARGRRAGGARPWSGGDAARAPPSCHEPPYRCSARAWRRRWQQGPRGVPPHPRPRQELEARLAPSLSSSGQRTTSSTPPLPPRRQRAQLRPGTQVGARARSAPAFGAERVARGSDPAVTGARARSAHAIGAERVKRGDAGSQCAAALSGCPTVPSAPVHDCTWFKVRQRPVFWPSGRVPSTLRARQCSPTTAPSGAGSAVPFFPGAPGFVCY